MINQSLDVSKLGFRWTGIYNTTKTYVNGDVAFKDGFAKAYINSSWVDFGIDQQDMVSGSVLLKDGNASGLPGQQFMVRNDGTVGFETPALRNGTLGVSLGGQDEIYSHNKTFLDYNYTTQYVLCQPYIFSFKNSYGVCRVSIYFATLFLCSIHPLMSALG